MSAAAAITELLHLHALESPRVDVAELPPIDPVRDVLGHTINLMGLEPVAAALGIILLGMMSGLLAYWLLTR